MLVFGTQLHVLTLLFIVLELMMFGYQFIYYLFRPDDKSRFYYLVLLKLMLLFNVTSGLFPDPKIRCISLPLQEMIAYGLGFLAAAYLPFYFYKALGLKPLRWHAFYGGPLSLLLPYLVFFVGDYRWHHDLLREQHYGMILPFIYAFVLLWHTLRAIHQKYHAAGNRQDYREEIAMYCAVSPWAAMTAFGLLDQHQLLEMCCTNAGIVVISALFIRKSILKARKEYQLLLEITAHGHDVIFEANCKRLVLTAREVEIVPHLIEGKPYKDIAELLFISERTVDTHVRNIYRKCGVNSKIALLNVLYRQYFG